LNSSKLFQLFLVAVIIYCISLIVFIIRNHDTWNRPRYPFSSLSNKEEIYLSRTETVSYKKLTKEFKQKLFEKCDREKGITVNAIDYVECWQGEPYETTSEKLWEVDVEDAEIRDEMERYNREIRFPE
jgi:hypothetical protein